MSHPPQETVSIKAAARGLASRLSTLAPENKEEVGLLALALGSVYAFQRAIELDFVPRNDRTFDELRSNALRFAAELSKGGPIDCGDDWLKGFYFNDSIMRAVFCLERSARYVTGLHGYNDGMGKVKSCAKRLGFPNTSVTVFDLASQYVNRVKHGTKERYGEDPKDLAELLPWITECVVCVEWIFSAKIPQRREGGGNP
ncbi:MAG: hypothetical protein E6Q76_05345 [Rhizobium sp.]|nr:MAG: hypothetical protein E6Q76_05345 [Rhizobium sp.]